MVSKRTVLYIVVSQLTMRLRGRIRRNVFLAACCYGTNAKYCLPKIMAKSSVMSNNDDGNSNTDTTVAVALSLLRWLVGGCHCHCRQGSLLYLFARGNSVSHLFMGNFDDNLMVFKCFLYSFRAATRTRRPSSPGEDSVSQMGNVKKFHVAARTLSTFFFELNLR